MATHDSTNPAQPSKTWPRMLWDEIRQRDERAYALVLALEAQLPVDLDPANAGYTTTTAHLLGLLNDHLSDQSLIYEFEKTFEVQS